MPRTAKGSHSGRGSKSSRLSAAVVCIPGLEEVTAGELRALGLRPKPAGPGLLECSVNHRELYAANVWLRTASRVLVRVATFRATDFVHLQDHAAAIDWGRWVPPGFAPSFRVSSNNSKLYHTKAIAQRLHQVSLPPSIDEPEQRFVVRIDRNTVTLSADSSGTALHHRPWRQELAAAPLRTTMAAAMIALSGWRPDQALVDPFCGAGTIGIEAALIRSGRPPGGERDFAFHHWPTFDAGSWASVVGSIDAALGGVDSVITTVTDDGWRSIPAPGSMAGPIVLSDRDERAVAAARANAEAAGVADLVEIDTRVVAHLPALRHRPAVGHRGGDGEGGGDGVDGSPAGHVITNPPYGKRVGGSSLTALYRRLGAVSRERLADCDLTLVTSGSALARAADGNLAPVASFRHGGLPVRVYHRPAPGLLQTDAGARADADSAADAGDRGDAGDGADADLVAEAGSPTKQSGAGISVTVPDGRPDPSPTPTPPASPASD